MVIDPYQYICRGIVIPLWARWERSPYLKHLKYLEESQYFSPEKIAEIQLRRIKNIVRHAYESCLFYKSTFDRDRIVPDDIRSLDDISSLPVLTKDKVSKYGVDMLATGVDRYASFLTSGSTGKPLRGFWDKECSEFNRACAVRSETWAGYRQGERVYLLYGDPDREIKGLRKMKARMRRKLLLRTHVLDMLRLTDQTMQAFTDRMLRKPPALLWGHAHGLYLFARFLQKRKVRDINPKGMYSAGMVLHDWERSLVEEVFKCKLQNRYGSEELGLIATECKEQKGLHINTDRHFVEFLKEDGTAAKPGEDGFIVVTDLWNMAMPLIRYKIEDICVASSHRCPCGRTQPLIEKIKGRIADFLVTPEGELVSGISLTDHFAGQIPGIEQIQIVQEKSDLLLFNTVKGDNFGPKTDEVVKRLVRDFFGEKMNFEYRFLDKIPQESSGKFRFAISRLGEKSLREG